MGYTTEEQQLTLDSFSTEAKANIRGRIMRTRKLLKHIDDNGVTIPKKKLIALFCIREGISKATVYTYLEEYFEAEIVVQYGDHILMKDQYEEIKAKDAERLKELL
jgi:hypothetical protein